MTAPASAAAHRRTAAVAAAALAVAVAAGCREGAPARARDAEVGAPPLAIVVMDRAPDAEGRLDSILRDAVFPVVRRTTPLRLTVDLVAQPDLAALARELDARAVDRVTRRRLAWQALARIDEVRAPLLAWLAAQPDASSVRAFRCVDRVALDGTERLARELARRDDVLHVWGRPRDGSGVGPARTPAAPRAAWDGRAPWALESLGAPAVHAQGVRGAGVVVAVLDSGVEHGHDALFGRLALAPWSASPRASGEGAEDGDRGQGHGLGVLGAAVAGEGLGVAPEARWTGADVLPGDRLDAEALAAGCDWLLGTAGADVVVAPWDVPPVPPAHALPLIFGALRTAGLAVVFPAGNGGPAPGTNRPPANVVGLAPDGAPALSVGGLARDGTAQALSSRGPNVRDGSLFPVVAAPAEGLVLLGASGPGAREIGDGTSYAAGFAAGAAALVLSVDARLTGPEAERLLRETARDVLAPGPDPVSGHGAIDLPAAVAAARALAASRR